MRYDDMTLPSGRKLEHNGLNLVRMLGEVGFVQWKDRPITLNSGVESRVYISGREDLTDNPGVLHHVGCRVAAEVKRLAIEAGIDIKKRMPCVLGIPVAGAKFAQSAAEHSYPSICFRTVRPEPKSHGQGADQLVEGRPDISRHFYMTVDNAITSGKALLEWLERIEADDYPVYDMIHLVFVDRQQGGVERLHSAGHCVESVFYLLDMIYVLVELGDWPRDRLRLVETELAVNRF